MVSPDRSFIEAYRRGFAMLPVAGEAFPSMSAKRRATLLEGHDPVLILEATSTVFADIEQELFESVLRRLPASEQRSVNAWRAKMAAEGTGVAATPVHPIGVLAATTLALGQSRPGARSDAARERIADLLVGVAIRFNDDVLNAGSHDSTSILAFMGRTALWRAVEDENWMIWSGELVRDLTALPAAAVLLATFREAADLTVEEWWYRGLGERATRALQGARSWVGTAGVDPRIEQAWSELTAVAVDDAVEAARAALVRRRPKDPPSVADPYDLTWLAPRPVVRTRGGRRFQLWLGANNRCLLPAGMAQVISDVTRVKYARVAEVVGRAAEHLLSGHIERLPAVAGEIRIPEADMPAGISRCDYLIEHGDVLIGLEFTISTPSRALSAGDGEAVRSLVVRFADKFQQVYSSFRWRDREQKRRWLPVLVLVSPSVVEPLLNERVHDELLARGVLAEGAPSELMTCHVPDFLDLADYVETAGTAFADAIVSWRDGELRGAALDWWLAERQAHRGSGRKRIASVVDRADAILSPAPTTTESE